MNRRVCEIVNHLVANDMRAGSWPECVYDVDELRTLPAILYPGKILNAAVNFYSLVNETGTEEERTVRGGNGARIAACHICF